MPPSLTFGEEMLETLVRCLLPRQAFQGLHSTRSRSVCTSGTTTSASLDGRDVHNDRQTRVGRELVGYGAACRHAHASSRVGMATSWFRACL